MLNSAHKVSISYFDNGLTKVIEGIWYPTENERRAAWEMYVEMVTRIPVAYVKPEVGLLRISLSSLYKLFDITREILRKYGSSVARPRDERQLSFGYLSIKVLDLVLRPFVMKWHPMLAEYERTKKESDSPQDHEKKWARYNEFDKAMNEVRETMMQYANLLALASEVPENLLID
ncbi:MAG: hypothetical protein LUQ38_10330 [Methanotrichaceae archaeon]|nr:hypothetical protein [Methanotrichaceae archaeon]MDD1758417.1 hypothetical protein [Methanotrichaceae archaeon]